MAVTNFEFEFSNDFFENFMFIPFWNYAQMFVEPSGLAVMLCLNAAKLSHAAPVAVHGRSI